MALARFAVFLVLLVSCGAVLPGQVIEFESGGLRYQTLTKNGVTIMFAHLPSQIREYAVLQVAVSNGSRRTRQIRPEDFTYVLENGAVFRARPARDIVQEMLEKASRSDVVRLISTYEMGIYGLKRINSTNGYEQRRQQFLAETANARLKAAAAASAISLVLTKLTPGESTDGAVFFATDGKPLGAGKLVVRAEGDVFEFRTGS